MGYTQSLNYIYDGHLYKQEREKTCLDFILFTKDHANRTHSGRKLIDNFITLVQKISFH